MERNERFRPRAPRFPGPRSGRAPDDHPGGAEAPRPPAAGGPPVDRGVHRHRAPGAQRLEPAGVGVRGGDGYGLRVELGKLYRRAADGYYEDADPVRRRRLSSGRHLAEHLHEVPALVIPCIRGRTDEADIYEQASQWASIIPATWSFMLAARARGLETAWTTWHLRYEREAARSSASHTARSCRPRSSRWPTRWAPNSGPPAASQWRASFAGRGGSRSLFDEAVRVARGVSAL
jgi:nitroreductase